MNAKNNFPRLALGVTLVAGVAIGAVSVGSLTRRDASFASFVPPANAPVVRPVAEVAMPNLGALKAFDTSMADLAEAVAPAVVHIRSENRPQTTVFGQSMPSGGQGSGFIFRPDGWILTNDHVVGGFDKVTVILNDGREFPGTVKRAAESDIALVKIEATELPTLRLADSKEVRPGQMAMAIGAPFGLENSVTIGHVSAVGRTNVIPDSRTGDTRTYWDLLQTDAPINVGNSGGPLINIDGQVIGINSAIFSATGGSNGIGFAISSNQARLLAETLIERGKVTRSFIGIQPASLKLFQKKEMNLEGGARVEEIPSDGPAAAAGIKKGDVIVRINQTPVLSELDLRNAMLRYAPGTTAEVEYVRDGRRATTNIRLANPPQLPQMRRQGPVRMDEMPPELRDRMRDFFERGDGPNGPRVPQPEGERAPQAGPVRLGVDIQGLDATARRQFNIPANKNGVVVTSVAPNSLAERLGMRTGDVIEQVGETRITTVQELRDAVSKLNWGDRATIRFSRHAANSSQTIVRDMPLR